MRTIRRTFIFAALAVVAFVCAWYIVAPQLTYKEPKTKVATSLRPVNQLQAFKLIDTDGNAFTEQSLRGHWTLLFFGYVGCPDICPATLNLIRESWNMFPADQPPARFVFANISGDPISIAELKQFLANYHEQFVGITGSNKEMQQLSKQLGIYAEQTGDRIDHTAALTLIDPHGRVRAIFTPPFTAEEVAQDLKVLTR